MEDFLPQLRKALAYTDTHTVRHLADEVREGRAQLWVDRGGMLVTRLDDAPTGRVLCFWVAAGEMDSVLALAERAYAWGRAAGCHRATFLGRRGWQKPLQAHRWQVRRDLVYYEKDLASDG